MTAQEIFDQLCAPFPTSDISWRVGPTNEKWRKDDEPLTGQALAYIDARVVMDRLDSVCGPGRWACNYTPGVGQSIVCNIGIRFQVFAAQPDGTQMQVGHEWIYKADGAGPSDMEAEKGTLSDAFKRAAVRWGVGRYLYDLKTPKVYLEKRGNSAVIPRDTYAKLDKFHDDFARKIIGDRQSA